MTYACQNLLRKMHVISTMFHGISTDDESSYAEASRHRLAEAGLLICQCPHWCEHVDILAKCMIDGETAPDCTILGVTSGDYPKMQKTS